MSHGTGASRRSRLRFVPAGADRLEARLALSHAQAGLAQVAPVTPATLNTSGRAKNLTAEAVDQVNQIFNSFESDYLQAQGAYFNSAPTVAATTRTIFSGYIRQRVSLLGEQLTRVFAQLPGGLNRLPTGVGFGGGAPGGSIVLQAFLRSRITGTGPGTLLTNLGGSTRTNATVILDPSLINAGAATLYTEQALTAIETARTATLNAAGYLLRHTFHNGHR